MCAKLFFPFIWISWFGVCAPFERVKISSFYFRHHFFFPDGILQWFHCNKCLLHVLWNNQTDRDLSFGAISISQSVWKWHTRVCGWRKKKDMPLRYILQWPRVAEAPALSTISGWGWKKSRSCPFLTAFPRSGVTSPGVDNHGVILLSVAASLTLTHIYIYIFFFYRSSVSFLPRAGSSLNVFFPPLDFSNWRSDYSRQNQSPYSRRQDNESVPNADRRKTAGPSLCDWDNQVIGVNVSEPSTETWCPASVCVAFIIWAPPHNNAPIHGCDDCLVQIQTGEKADYDAMD